MSDRDQTKDLMTIDAVRRAWLMRAAACGYKGKARDKACLEYLSGARIALLFAAGEMDNPDAKTALDQHVYFAAVIGCGSFEKGSN